MKSKNVQTWEKLKSTYKKVAEKAEELGFTNLYEMERKSASNAQELRKLFMSKV